MRTCGATAGPTARYCDMVVWLHHGAILDMHARQNAPHCRRHCTTRQHRRRLHDWLTSLHSVGRGSSSSIRYQAWASNYRLTDTRLTRRV